VANGHRGAQAEPGLVIVDARKGQGMDRSFLAAAVTQEEHEALGVRASVARRS
jgi:hypothetical protein